MSLKCKTGRLVMCEAVPYGQRWTYASSDPMSEMIKPEYYANVADQIRSGDSIRIMNVDREDVREVAEYLIASKSGQSLVLIEVMKPIKIPAPSGKVELPPKVRNLKIEEGKGCVYLVDDNGDIRGEFSTKAEANKAKPELERAA